VNVLTPQSNELFLILLANPFDVQRKRGHLRYGDADTSAGVAMRGKLSHPYAPSDRIDADAERDGGLFERNVRHPRLSFTVIIIP